MPSIVKLYNCKSSNCQIIRLLNYKMKKILSIISTALLLLTMGACRPESDTLVSYDHKDALVFDAADTSFAAKFQIMWNGLNQNYVIWDYEAEHGVDWDAIYDEYYPQFEALDRRSKDATVTDDELKALMQKCLGSLHDGHFYFEMKNHKTGNTVSYYPSLDRNASRDDYKFAQTFSPNLKYYADVTHGEVETDAQGNPIVKSYNTTALNMLTAFFATPGIGLTWAIDRYKELSALPNPTEMEVFQCNQLKAFVNEMSSGASGKPVEIAVTAYNRLREKYSFLEIPCFDYIDPAFLEKGITFDFALLKGNIAYFHVSRFAMSVYLDDTSSQKVFDLSNPATKNHIQQMREVWQAWFDTVQQLHKSGTLGGVILDVRSNGGGDTDDFQYFVGSLLPAGGLQTCYQRYKRGTGRYDYSPMMEGRVLTMSTPHETITEPVVILTNCWSVSMSEMSTLGVKTMSNGKVIGKRTWGGLCPLTDNEMNTFNYSGFIGVKNETPVFGYVPMLAAFTLDKKLIEGEGIAPDIEVAFDQQLFQTTGQDTQLDRALRYVRTGQ